MTKKKGDGPDRRWLRALAHPLRVRILEVLGEQPASPIQMAQVLNERLGNVAYHTRVLLDCEFIELLETRPARGAVEHIYRVAPPSEIGSRNWSTLTVDDEGWGELLKILERVEEQLKVVAKNCAERMQAPGDGMPVVVTAAAFEATAKGKGQKE